MCDERILKPVNNRPEWGSSLFAIPKKDGTIRVLKNFRVLNQQLIRKPLPMPLIQDVLQTINTYLWAVCIDLGMVYYSMGLDEGSKKLCIICFPWGL